MFSRVYIFQGMAICYQLRKAGSPLGREAVFQLVIIASPQSIVCSFFVFLHDQAYQFMIPFICVPTLL